MNLNFQTAATMAEGYLQAAEFTDFGEDGPENGATFASEADYHALAICSQFLSEFDHLIVIAIEKHGYSYIQAGHDLWFTRNGHGVGFWDRGLDSVITDEDGCDWILGDALTSVSKELGESHVFQHDNGLVYFE